ncbi:tryptophan--tRNA ligase [Candidatus Bathyarchaeota archaeon]|mgnify:CR=1 FL=1|nr:tryptophan--tRNA ligase [Candidatus Bathyarchaeota archaeon]
MEEGGETGVAEKRESNKKLDPFGTTLVKDYERLYAEFGIQPFKPLLPQIPNPSAAMRRGVIFGHRDFERILEAMRRNEEFAVMSGIKPTGEFHLGTLMTAREIIYFQQQGAVAFYCIADVEAYEDNGIPFEESEKIAVNNVADILALGFDPKRGYIYRQSRENRVKDLAIMFGRGVTLATMKAIYGERHMGLYLSALIQAGDILMPQLEDFGGPKPTVVPVGVDQDPHIRFTRDLAAKFHSKYGFIPPSSTYHKLIKALDGGYKMSKRNPMSYFTLDEDPDVIAKKISYAFTGGQPTAEEQRKFGGNPDVCPIFDLYLFHFFEDDRDVIELYNDCKCGNILCGEDKARLIKIVTEFIKEHQRKKRRCIDKAREILGVE